MMMEMMMMEMMMMKMMMMEMMMMQGSDSLQSRHSNGVHAQDDEQEVTHSRRKEDMRNDNKQILHVFICQTLLIL